MRSQWIVSLNDGQRISQKSLLNGTDNPWTKLFSYIANNPINPNGDKKVITHVELIVNNARYNSPTFNRNNMFYSSDDVKRFWIFQKATARIAANKMPEDFISYSYRTGDYRHFFWVNEANNFCYSQVLNVVVPVTDLDRHFKGIEQTITKRYEQIE